jgi:ferric-dicitrate binding protein FerR (iron transport regulator)
LSREHDREANLRRVVRDARNEQPPSLHWQAIEERLMRELQRSVPAVQKRSPYPVAWGVLAAAAALTLWLVTGRAHVALPHTSPDVIEATQPLRKSGEELAVGSRVVAEDRDVSVVHNARATWTLVPGSSAVLLEKGARINVKLERGSVLSEVAPTPHPETFVIEAEGARVAVHGTVFRVELTGDKVIVNVREGTVAVGARGSVPTYFLKAPAHGEFSLDGRNGSIDGRELGGEARAAARRSYGGSSRARPVATAAQTGSAGAAANTTEPGEPMAEDDQSLAAVEEVPAEPSIQDIETGVARIVGSTSDCFSQNTKGAEGIEITVRTALTLNIAPSGEIADVDFQPPLSPEVEACATSSIASVAFSDSQQGAKVTRMLELKR